MSCALCAVNVNGSDRGGIIVFMKTSSFLLLRYDTNFFEFYAVGALAPLLVLSNRTETLYKVRFVQAFFQF